MLAFLIIFGFGVLLGAVLFGSGGDDTNDPQGGL